MLDMFRNKGLQSAVYVVLIVATVVVFVIQFNPSAGKQSAKLTQSCAATVRGTCIEPKDHKAEFMLLVPFDEHGARLMGRAKQMHIPQIALDGLIERQLLIDEAHRIGLTVSDDEINDAIISGFLRVSIPADKPELENVLQPPAIDGKRYFGFWFRDPKTKDFDQKVYARNVKNLVGESEVEFRQFETDEILAAKMRDIVRAPVRVSEQEALESYLNEKSLAVLTYVEVRPQFVARYSNPQPASDALIEEWAKKPEDAALVASTLEARKKDPPKDGNIRHILVKVAPSDGPKEHAKALAKITEAYSRIQRGEPFAEVARALSEDSSKNKGGSLETDKTDGFVPAFKAAAAKLGNGDMTQTAIESQFGYHLIMRDDSSRLAKDVARELYYKAMNHDAARAFAERIQAAIKAGKSPDDAIHAEMASLKPIPFIKVTPDTTLDRKPTASADAGAPDATAASTGDAGAKPTKPEPVETQLDPNKDDDRPQALTSNSVRRGGDTLPKLGAADAANVLQFAFTAKDGEVMNQPVQMSDGGYYVVELKSHKLATPEEFQKDRGPYMDQMLHARQNEALALYMKRLLDAARPDIHKDEAYMASWTSDAGAGSDEDEP
ncbi:MAG TPA: peptidylprolyl isomerase [Polyangiaceae bacterium]|jgi:peptidyl-prolyl cis-trans isomerase D